MPWSLSVTAKAAIPGPFIAPAAAYQSQSEAVATDHGARLRGAVRNNLRDRSIVCLLSPRQARQREARRAATDAAERGRRHHAEAGPQGEPLILLKNPHHLESQRNERQRLHEALELNRSRATAYCMKEDVRRLRTQPPDPRGPASSKAGSLAPRSQVSVSFKASQEPSPTTARECCPLTRSAPPLGRCKPSITRSRSSIAWSLTTAIASS